MKTPWYGVLKADAAVLALLGGPEPRIYPWGENDDAKRVYPYITYSGDYEPFNTLADRPEIDGVPLQLDIWAESDTSAQSVALALRDAIELHCDIHAMRLMGRAAGTRNYRIRFDTQWWVRRA